MRRLFRNDGVKGREGALHKIAMRIATGLAVGLLVCPSLSASAVEGEKALPGYNGLTLNTSHYAYGTWTIPVTDVWTENNNGYVVYPEEQHNITFSTPANNSGMHLYECTTTRGSRIYVNKWRLAFRTHICSHHEYSGTNFYGVTVGSSSCAKRKEKAQRLSSGWIPTCATCGREYPFYFYGSEEDIKKIDALPAGSFYYSLCVGTNDEDNSACRNMEQGIILDHTCVAQSVNQFQIYYYGNGATGGSMGNTTHYYSSAGTVLYDGKSVTNTLNLADNKFSKTGYTFVGWSFTRGGAVDINGGAGIGDPSNPAEGTILYEAKTHSAWKKGDHGGAPNNGDYLQLYAVWTKKQRSSSVTINPNGGKYKNQPRNQVITGDVGSKLTIYASDITPPSGDVVTFHTNGGGGIGYSNNQMISDAVFSHCSFSGNGQFADNTYTFPLVSKNDTITFEYINKAIVLPPTAMRDYIFAGWYSDSGLTHFVGMNGYNYIPPKGGSHLYARWMPIGNINLDVVLDKDDIGVKPNTNSTAKWTPIGSNHSYRVEYSKVGESYAIQNTSGVTSISPDPKVYPGESTSTNFPYTFPASGYYTIEIAGGQGADMGSKRGGKGAMINARAFFPKGTQLTVHVGRKGAGSKGGSTGAKGGGASYIKLGERYLLVAGGGGGAGANAIGGGSDTCSTNPNPDYLGAFQIATAGNGDAGGGGGDGYSSGVTGAKNKGGTGGQSFISNARFSPNLYTYTANTQMGDGYVKITSYDLKEVSNDVTSLGNLVVRDQAGPNAVSNIVTGGDGRTKFKVSWSIPEDNGTQYQYRVRGMVVDGNHTYVYSNEVKPTITTGVGGFYYTIDYNANTQVTASTTNKTQVTRSALNQTFSIERNYTDFNENSYVYFHIAAVDRQGNWSATSHKQIYIPRRTYTITFNGNGGSVSGPTSLRVTHGQGITCTTSAFASGWTFTGWYTVENGAYKDLIIESSEPSLRPVGDGTYFDESGRWIGTQDLTLYARWEKIPDPDYSSVTVVFHKNEPGSTTDVSYSRVYTERVTGQQFANDQAWFVTGYELNNWWESGTSNYYPITCGVSDAWIVGRNKQTVHLYAQWSPKTYQIAFDYHMPEGHALPGNAEMVRAVTYKGSVGVLPSPTTTGYTFKGWYKEDTYRTKVADNSTYDTPGDSLLHGKWTANTYTVRLWPNKPGTASGNVSFLAPAGWTNKDGHYEAVFTYDKESTLPSPAGVYSLFGWSCTGWHTSAAGGNLIGSGTKAWNLTGSGYVDLYPVWSAAVYTITLNPFDATEPGTTVIYEKYDTGFYSDEACTRLITSINPPKKTNFSPEGYYTQSLKEGTQMISAAGQFTGNMKPNVFGGNAVLIEK